MATGYSRVYDTVVSGSALASALNGLQVRDLEFASAVNNNPVILCYTGHILSAEDLIEASVRNQLVYGGATQTTGWLSLGSDTNSQALAYIRLFNFQTDDVLAQTYRVTQFAVSSGYTGNIQLKNGGGSSTFVKVNGGQTASLFDGNVVGDSNVVLVHALNLNLGSESVEFIVGSTQAP